VGAEPGAEHRAVNEELLVGVLDSPGVLLFAAHSRELDRRQELARLLGHVLDELGLDRELLLVVLPATRDRGDHDARQYGPHDEQRERMREHLDGACDATGHVTRGYQRPRLG
jgi:hypothetical protein